MVGSQHRQHAQKGGGGADGGVYHSRDELHRIPDGLCDDVVAAASARPEVDTWVCPPRDRIVRVTARWTRGCVHLV
jgi:hypothetical protein